MDCLVKIEVKPVAFFKKKCAYCGMKLSDSNFTERMGKKFCSVNHAEEFMSHQSRPARGGGCC